MRGHVIIGDATHTQTDHAERITAQGAHYILAVRGNRKRLRRQPQRLHWREIPLQHRTRDTNHGRREIRGPKACTLEPGQLFPHAVQAIEIKRRRTKRKIGETTAKMVDVSTSLTLARATRPHSHN
ncbi:transposase [Streptomyces broussonetiae]|uniref:Transposase n=1 Tax=Streptomyces broussonetiae TaxID=2686304 RepID=A0A6I6NFU1_9ACTN|nr:transposase [Streptomyces broussonetiae]QHA10182.1 transposase [Streptomyces broussonetiae]